MTVGELHIGIDQELQDTGLFVNEDYQREEVDFVINQEARNMIKKALPKDILGGITLDSFTESNEKLQNVIASNKQIAVISNQVLLPNGTTVKDINGDILKKYSFLLSAVCSGEWCGQDHTAPLRIVSNARFRNAVKHAYYKSKTYSVLAQHTQGKIFIESPTDFKNDPFKITSIKLDYICQLVAVSYTTNKDDEYDQIPSDFHDELIRSCTRRMRGRNNPSLETQIIEEKINNN